MASVDVMLPTTIATPVHSHSITSTQHPSTTTHIIQVQGGNKQINSNDTINANKSLHNGTNLYNSNGTVHINQSRSNSNNNVQQNVAVDRPTLHIHTQHTPSQPHNNVQIINPSLQPQMHVKVTPPGTLDVSDDSEGDYDSEDDYDDDVSSEDNSPRENRVLTFADEHGANLCDFCYYEPEPAEHDDSTYEHYQQPLREMQPTGCFACFMQPRMQQPVKT